MKTNEATEDHADSYVSESEANAYAAAAVRRPPSDEELKRAAAVTEGWFPPRCVTCERLLECPDCGPPQVADAKTYPLSSDEASR